VLNSCYNCQFISSRNNNNNPLGSQLGTIKVTCSDGLFAPDIFSALDTWCAEGCSPIPTDDRYFWSPTYRSSSLSSANSSAPLLALPTQSATVGCREGYIVRMGDSGKNTTVCEGGGWSDMGSLVECVPGCSDVTGSGTNRVSLTKKRSSGYAPFVTGQHFIYKNIISTEFYHFLEQTN